MPAPMAGGPFHAPQSISMRYREPRALDQSWNEKKPKPSGVAAVNDSAEDPREELPE